MTRSRVTDPGPGGSPTFKDRIEETGVDPDFCGTGESVNFAIRLVAQVWIGETGGAEQELKVAFNFVGTLTNPDNGATVVDHSAGLFTNVVVTGLESGAHTHEFVENGLRAKLKLANGRVLTRDAGSLVYRVSLDANGDFVSLEIVSLHGPHPAFQSDVWCDAATEALGL